MALIKSCLASGSGVKDTYLYGIGVGSGTAATASLTLLPEDVENFTAFTLTKVAGSATVGTAEVSYRDSSFGVLDSPTTVTVGSATQIPTPPANAVYLYITTQLSGSYNSGVMQAVFE